jgi:cyclophilin family peptidyl-prolyl cis-trans isomerase
MTESRPPSGRRAKRRARRLDGSVFQPGEPGRPSPGLPTRRPLPPRRSVWNSQWTAAIAVFAGLLVVIGAWAFVSGNAAPAASPAASGGVTRATSGQAGARGHDCPTSQPAALAAGQTRTVTIKTSKGDVVIQVDGSLSPIAAGNFVALASCGFYDGLVFHRVVPGFVIQGGDPNGDGSGGPGYTIADEPVTAPYQRGTVAMARTTEPNSQGSQFFIVLADDAAQSLTQVQPCCGYAIFGTVTSGMDAVDAIAAAADQELPTNPIQMTSVTVSNP